MATLKSKASKSSSTGGLAAKASARGVGKDKVPPDDVSQHNLLPTNPSSFNQSPPPPPPLQYLRLYSMIPSLRKNNQGIQ